MQILQPTIHKIFISIKNRPRLLPRTFARNWMKQFTLILLLNLSTFSYSQVELKLYALNECDGEVKNLTFELADESFHLNPDLDLEEKYSKFFSKPISLPRGRYFVLYNYEIKNTDHFSIKNGFKIDLSELTTYSDTIVMPKIRLGWTTGLHSNTRYYFNCDKKCHGTEIDYFKNGNKRLKGIFRHGIPMEIAHYDTDGNLKTIELFRNDRFEPYKIMRYDSNILMEYETRIFRRKKMIVRTYDKDHTLIKKNKLR